MLKQSRLVDAPAQWSVCQELDFHLSHTIRQGVAEDSRLMLRGKVAFLPGTNQECYLTPISSWIYETLSAQSLIEASWGHIDVKILYSEFRVFQPDQTSVGIGTLCGWKHFVKSWLSASGFCGTILIPYISCLAKQLETILPGMKNHAHLKHQPSDYYRLNILGASVFAHLGVDARGTGRSIGVPNFQVRETMRTWNINHLITIDLTF